MFHFISMYFRLWKRHQISLRAAALTYTLILALVPLLAVCLSAFTIFVDVRDLSKRFMTFLMGHLAPGSGHVVANYIQNFLEKVHFKALGYFGFGALLITSLLLLSSIESSINQIWSIRKKKRLWKRVLIYNLILIAGPLCVSLSIATVTVVTRFFPEYVSKANLGASLVNFLFLTFTYKIFPNKRVRWSAAAIAGTAATAALEAAKWGYRVYTAKALFYNKVYGGLAVLPFFLIWVYVNWNIFLGAALLSYMVQDGRNIRSPNPKKQQREEKEDKEKGAHA
jgi:membrane protein